MRLATLISVLFFVAWFTPNAGAEPISAAAISVVDGDTIDVGPQRYRMVGYDTPETVGISRRPVADDEKVIGRIAKDRLAELLQSGPLDLTEVPCACPKSTIGTSACNYGRKCAILTLNGTNIGDPLIAEGLAVPFTCKIRNCRMPDWPKIIRSQFPESLSTR